MDPLCTLNFLYSFNTASFSYAAVLNSQVCNNLPVFFYPILHHVFHDIHWGLDFVFYFPLLCVNPYISSWMSIFSPRNIPNPSVSWKLNVKRMFPSVGESRSMFKLKKYIFKHTGEKFVLSEGSQYLEIQSSNAFAQAVIAI